MQLQNFSVIKLLKIITSKLLNFIGINLFRGNLPSSSYFKPIKELPFFMAKVWAALIGHVLNSNHT